MTTESQATEQLGTFEESDRRLRRTMGLNSLLFMSLGAIIGSGWLLASLAAASIAGPAAIVSWVIGGILVIFIAMNYAELSGMLPRSGAIVRYPALTHGGYTGWIIGWTYWLSAISVPAIEAEAVVTYVGGRFPGAKFEHVSAGVTVLSWPNGILFAIGLMAVFFVLNLLGIRLLGEVNRWVTWWKVVIPTLTFIFLFTIMRASNFHSFGGFAPLGTGKIFEAVATSGILFSYLGFRQALDYAGESKNPQRDVPRATILSVLIAVVIYTLLQVGFIGALHWGAAKVHTGDWAGLSGSPWASAPLYDAFTAAGVGWLASYASVLLYDAGISPSGTGWIYMGTAARTNYGLSVQGFGPKGLQRTNRFGIPWVSVILALVVGLLFLIPAPSWYKLVGFISSTTALTYIMGGMGLPAMRRHAGSLHRPYRLPAAGFWAPVGFLAAMMVVYWSGFSVLVNVYAAVFVGLTLFVWYYAPMRGWLSNQVGATIGVIFLAVWIYICYAGGFVLTNAASGHRGGAWSFGLFDVVLSAAVLAFTGVVYALGTAEAKLHIKSSMWLIVMLLAIFPLSYYGEFGELSKPSITFPYGTLICIGIGLAAFYWGSASSFRTPELEDILSQAARDTGGSPTAGGVTAEV